MGDPHADQIVLELNRFIVEVITNPSVIVGDPAKFKAKVRLAIRLAMIAPKATKIAGELFEPFIRNLAANAMLREAVKAQLWTQQFGGIFSDLMMKLPPTPPSKNSSTQDMQKYQREMSEYTNYTQLMSNLLKMLEDTNKAIIGNIR